MPSIPNPLLIWALALATLGLGLRSRRRGQPAPQFSIPLVLRVACLIPVPTSWATKSATQRLRETVVAAGLDGDWGVARFARSRVGLAALGGAIGMVVAIAHPIGVALAGLLAAAGYAAATRWVHVRARTRRRRVVRDLPDLIDLVVICTEAGMALEPSLRLAVTRLPGPLGDEVGHALRELDFGTPRRDAYVALSRRLGVPELTGLVGALLQADELGAPIASVLRRQGELLRSARTQDIRDHAARAAPKVQLVVAMVMVPSALMVVLGVLVIHLIGQIGGVAGGIG